MNSVEVKKWSPGRLAGGKVLTFANAQRIKFDAFFPFLLSNSVSL